MCSGPRRWIEAAITMSGQTKKDPRMSLPLVYRRCADDSLDHSGGVAGLLRSGCSMKYTSSVLLAAERCITVLSFSEQCHPTPPILCGQLFFILGRPSPPKFIPFHHFKTSLYGRQTTPLSLSLSLPPSPRQYLHVVPRMQEVCWLVQQETLTSCSMHNQFRNSECVYLFSQPFLLQACQFSIMS